MNNTDSYEWTQLMITLLIVKIEFTKSEDNDKSYNVAGIRKWGTYDGTSFFLLNWQSMESVDKR